MRAFSIFALLVCMLATWFAPNYYRVCFTFIAFMYGFVLARESAWLLGKKR